MGKLLDKALGGRYKTFPLKSGSTYIFDKLLFVILMFVLLSFSVIIIASNGFDSSQHVYAKCDDKNGCFNPYYNNPMVCGKSIPTTHELCTTQPLPYNYSYGTPEPFYITGGVLIVLSLFVITLLTNHFMYNKGKLLEELKYDERNKAYSN